MAKKFVVTIEVEQINDEYDIQELTRDVSDIIFDHYSVNRYDVQVDDFEQDESPTVVNLRTSGGVTEALANAIANKIVNGGR